MGIIYLNRWKEYLKLKKMSLSSATKNAFKINLKLQAKNSI